MKESHRFAVWLKDWVSNPDIALPHLQSDWEDTKNPFFVWSAINVCDLNQRELPDWVRAYLASCARRMVSEDAVQKSDLRKILPGVLGFPQKKRGPGPLLRPEGDGVIFHGHLCVGCAKAQHRSASEREGCLWDDVIE